MLVRGAATAVLVARDDRVEDRAVALGDFDQRVVLLDEARQAQVVEHLVDDVDDARVAGAREQAEVEGAVEVQERGRVAPAGGVDARVDDPAQVVGVRLVRARRRGG